MWDVTAPASVGKTDNFEFKLYRSYDLATSPKLTNMMLSGTKSLDGGIFKSGTITGGVFDEKINFVQTTNIINFSFKVQNKIPVYTNNQYYPRIVIVLPKGMTALESDV